MPDEVPRPAGDPEPGTPTVDLLDGLLRWLAAWGDVPAMIDGRGEPASWRHYRYGLDRLGRADAEHSARIGGAMRAAQSEEQHYNAWRRKQRSVGGW